MIRSLLAVLAALFLLGGSSESAHARDLGFLSLPNTYNFPDTRDGDNFNTLGQRRAYPIIDGTTAIIPTIGQSKIANNSASPAAPYTPTNASKCFVLNPYDGAYYVAADPVLGATATNGYFYAGWHGRLCDKLLAGTPKYTQVVFVPMAVSGASVSDWKSGGAYNNRLTAAATMISAKGLSVTFVMWQQGVTDAINGMSQSTYQTDLRAVISYWRGLTGHSSDRWMIAQDTINGAGNSTSSAIRAAQAAVAGDANNALGPDADTLGFSTYTDGLHYNTTGNDAIAGLWDTRIRAAY